MKHVVLGLAMMVGAVSFAQNKDVVDIAIGSESHTTLVAAVKAAGLVETLKGDGPFTVFAPTNEAFAELPDGTVETLLKEENKEQLTSILTYHVVSGNLDAEAVVSAVKEADGSLSVETVSGGMLTVTLEDSKVKLTDENGNSAYVTQPDLKGSNGVVHVINSVVLPE